MTGDVDVVDVSSCSYLSLSVLSLASMQCNNIMQCFKLFIFVLFYICYCSAVDIMRKAHKDRQIEAVVTCNANK